MRSPAFPLMLDDVLLPRGGCFELYDLEADPGERSNLAGKEEWAAVEAELKRALLTWMQETGDPLLDGPVASPFYYRAIRGLRAG